VYVHCVNDVRQTKIDTRGSLLPDTCPFEVEITIYKLIKYKSPGIYQIPTELPQVGVNTLSSETYKFNFI